VYQTVMGFRLEIAAGPSIAIKGKAKKGGVPAATTINLDELLAAPAKDRPKWLAARTDQELSGDAEKALKAAASIDGLLAALERKVARNATPAPVAKGGLVLQPTDERRRSGSHYTPRAFTQPIVRKTLAPILRRLSEQAQRAKPETRIPNTETNPKPEIRKQPSNSPAATRTSDSYPLPPEAILSLKICDLAVGSAAFLVETCRQLAEELLKAWRHHGGRPQFPGDETEELLAMRLIAQHCLYGVDRNSMAVDLAKLSLWLATLAKDHPFTFLDHAIRCGDSLVGLTRRQIEDFTWGPPTGQRFLFAEDVRKRTAAALRERQALLALGDDYTSPQLKREKLEAAEERLELVRFIGDAAIAAFFSAAKDKAREQKRIELAARISDYLAKGDPSQRPTAEVTSLRSGEFPIRPFHWEVEFPEVFDRDNPGFDAIVGNPPFMGGSKITSSNGDAYLEWLKVLNAETSGNADLVAHFFRRAFDLLASNGSFGLIATNTIGQGDTRAGGLRWICAHGGTIYAARKRYKWPGFVAVVVSVVWVTKEFHSGPMDLDDESVPLITAYLFHAGGNDSPSALNANHGRAFKGVGVNGMGFTFDDTDKHGVTSPIALSRELITEDRRNAERIFPYIGGEELNDSPTLSHSRFIINFEELSEGEARKWPALFRILEEKVRPERSKSKDLRCRERWWQFERPRSDLASLLSNFKRTLVCSRVTPHLTFAFLPARTVFADSLIVAAFDQHGSLCILQSRPHELWARFCCSTAMDLMRYTPSDCFETFPFPAGFEASAALEAAGREYYEFRTALMVRHNEGLTKTYNRFHDPEETSPDILRLRELHAAMDRAVLEAYDWPDLIPQCQCEFLLDYEDEDDGAEDTGRRRKKPWRDRRQIRQACQTIRDQTFKGRENATRFGHRRSRRDRAEVAHRFPSARVTTVALHHESRCRLVVRSRRQPVLAAIARRFHSGNNAQADPTPRTR
jgi:hypothetical protein